MTGVFNKKEPQASLPTTLNFKSAFDGYAQNTRPAAKKLIL